MKDTSGDDYAERLRRKQTVWWKRLLPVQAPYRYNLRRQQLGRTLDVGCGIGRNFDILPSGSLGVDHNASAIDTMRSKGYNAMTVDEFKVSDQAQPASFDAMLLAHVIEHMEESEAVLLLQDYLPYLRPGAKVFMICPQERGYASDPTHVRFATGDDLAALARKVGLTPQQPFSFPFPRWAGRPFIYNEFCLVATLPAAPN